MPLASIAAWRFGRVASRSSRAIALEPPQTKNGSPGAELRSDAAHERNVGLPQRGISRPVGKLRFKVPATGLARNTALMASAVAFHECQGVATSCAVAYLKNALFGSF